MATDYTTYNKSVSALNASLDAVSALAAKVEAATNGTISNADLLVVAQALQAATEGTALLMFNFVASKKGLPDTFEQV